MAKRIESDSFINKTGILRDLDEISKSLLELQKQSLAFQNAVAKNLNVINKEMLELASTVSKMQNSLRGFSGATKEQRAEAKNLAVEIVNLAGEFQKQKEAQKGANQVQKDNVTTVKELEKQYKKLRNEAKEINVETKEGREKFKNLAKEVRATKEQVKTFGDALKSTNNVFDSANKSYNGLVRQNRKLSEEVRKLNPEISEEAKRIKLLQREIRANTDTLKRFDEAMGRNFRNVGNYQSALKGATGQMIKLGTALGAGFLGIQAVANGIREGFQAFVGFEFQIAKVGAVSGATRSELAQLEAKARELGESTQFTATQAGELELEFAKLGFTVPEILNATGATLDLATATGEGLAESAAVAGATLRGFGIDAEQTSRVTDVMAKSFSSSALDLENFRESMKFVAPVAKAAGVSIEEATAMLSSLADAGIKGSNAGTALRRILTDMANTGKPASEALRDISEKGITLTGAMDEVGRTAQTALLVLAENQAKTDRLSISYRNATGSASAMAEQMRNTTKGAVDQLNSAMEGLAINLFSELSPAINAVIKGITGLVGWLNSWFKVSPVDQIEAERFELLALTEALKSSNDNREVQNAIIEEINQKYPGLLSNIKAEQLNNQDLDKVLKETVSSEQGKSDLISEITAKYPRLLKDIDAEKITSEELASVLGQKLNKKGLERQQIVATLTRLQPALVDSLITEKITTEELATSLVKTNSEGNQRKQLIEALQSTYPNFLSNIDTEKITTEELGEAIETKANESTENRAKLINTINSISPTLIENLQREKIATEDITEATNLLNRELQRKIFIQLKAEAKEQLKEESAEVLRQATLVTKLRQEIGGSQQERAKTLKILKEENLEGLTRVQIAGRLTKLVNEGRITQQQLLNLTKQQGKISEGIQQALVRGTERQGGVLAIQQKRLKELNEEYKRQEEAIIENARLAGFLPEELQESEQKTKEVTKETEELNKVIDGTAKGISNVVNEAEKLRKIAEERRKLNEKVFSNEIKELQLLLDNEKLSIDAKIALNQQLFDKRESLLNEQAQNEIARITESEQNEKLRAEKVSLVNQELANDLTENQAKLNSEIEKLNKERFDNEKKEIQDAIKAINQALETEQITLSERVLEDLTKLSEAFKNGEISFQEFQERLTEIQKEESQKRLENEIKSLQKQLEIEGLSAEQKTSIQKDLTQKQRQLLESSIEEQKELTGDFLKDILNLSEQQIKIVKATLELGAQASQLIINSFNTQLANIDAEQQAVEAKFARQLELAKGNATLEKQIQEKLNAELEVLDQKRAKVEVKKFNFDKALKIAGAVGNIAQGITKTIAEFGFPLAIPFIAAIGAIGGVQIAQIASTKPPQGFKEGTERLALDGNPKGTDTIPAILRSKNTRVAMPILLDENERILTANQNKQIGYDFPNEKIPKAVDFYKEYYGTTLKRSLDSDEMTKAPLRDLNRSQIIMVKMQSEQSERALRGIYGEMQKSNQIARQNTKANQVSRDANIANLDQTASLKREMQKANDAKYYTTNK